MKHHAIKQRDANKKIAPPTKIRYALMTVGSIIASILLLWGLRCAFLHLQYQNPNQDYFGTAYCEIFFVTSPSAYQTSSQLMEQVDEAFSFIGTGSQATSRLGTLSRYSTLIESYPTATSEKHSVSFLASSLKETRGYLWFSYYNGRFDNNQDTIGGSGSLFKPCLVRLSLRKVNTEWIVEDIKEHP